jgi:hypothetical protein
VTKKKGKKEHFAFGPFLSIGIAVSLYANLGVTVICRYADMLAVIANK